MPDPIKIYNTEVTMDLQRKLDFIENYRTVLELLKHKEMRIDYSFPSGNGKDDLIVEVYHGTASEADQG